MSEKYKANTDHPYFVTFTLVAWIDLFTRKCYSNLLLDSFEFCIQKKGMALHEYVIMPSHIHFIAHHNEAKLWAVIRDFKSYTAQHIYKMVKEEPTESRRSWILNIFHYYANNKKQNKNYQVWKKCNRPIVLDSVKTYNLRRNYIWENPVEAEYVDESWHWRNSSAKKDNALRDLLFNADG